MKLVFATPLERESQKWACGRESAPIDARRGGQTLENSSIWACKNNGFSTTTKSLHTCSSESVGNIPQNTFATPLERESQKWALRADRHTCRIPRVGGSDRYGDGSDRYGEMPSVIYFSYVIGMAMDPTGMAIHPISPYLSDPSPYLSDPGPLQAPPTKP